MTFGETVCVCVVGVPASVPWTAAVPFWKVARIVASTPLNEPSAENAIGVQSGV